MDNTSSRSQLDCSDSGPCGRWRWAHSLSSPRKTLNSKVRRNEGGGNEASETFAADVRGIWQRPVLAGSLAKDLPRLAHRVTIRTRTGRDILPPGSGQGGQGQATSRGLTMGSVETWTLIEGLVVTLVRELEAHRLLEIQMGLQAIGSRVGTTTELELVVPELVLLLGEDSKALKALKMVDQGVLLLGVNFMKGGVTRGLITKDVRSSDGWQIGLDVFEQVQVYHQRREQSVDALSGANNHFELDFEVRVTFDRDMSSLTSVGLRVQRLTCAPTMQPEMRVYLESRILGDLIVV